MRPVAPLRCQRHSASAHGSQTAPEAHRVACWHHANPPSHSRSERHQGDVPRGSQIPFLCFIRCRGRCCGSSKYHGAIGEEGVRAGGCHGIGRAHPAPGQSMSSANTAANPAQRLLRHTLSPLRWFLRVWLCAVWFLLLALHS